MTTITAEEAQIHTCRWHTRTYESESDAHTWAAIIADSSAYPVSEGPFVFGPFPTDGGTEEWLVEFCEWLD